MESYQLLLEVFVLSFGIGFAVYAYFTWKLNHFARKKIPFLKAYPILGNWTPVVFRQVSFSEYGRDMYNGLKGHRFGGIFEFSKPTVLIRDPELIKLIMVKDFDHFVDRSDLVPEDADELFGKSVFSLTGNKWRHMRNTLSPAFTSSKMKSMFLLVNDCGKQLAEYLESKIQEHEAETGQQLSLEFKDLYSKYTNDVIGTSAFGVQCDSLRNPENEFYKVGKDVTNFGGLQGLIFLGFILSKRVMKFFRMSLINKGAKKFLKALVTDTMATREREGIVRPDMIHLLMQAKKGELKTEAGEDEQNNEIQKIDTQELSDEDITAQAFVFFLAGFETTSTLLAFTTYFLAIHPDIQERLHDEVDYVMEESGRKLTYEGVQKMKYMDMVLNETLRIYPAVESVDRRCVKKYTIPATASSPELALEKGDTLFFPVYAFHHDPDHFPEPEKFDPERFNDENKHNIRPFTYMPFGVGPRNCIGMRFAMMETKAALAHVLSRFSVHVVAKTQIPLVLSTKTFNITTDEGFWLGIRHRQVASDH